MEFRFLIGRMVLLVKIRILGKYLKETDELLEGSNPVDLIIFPEGHEKQRGRCIGNSSEHPDVPCKYSAGLDQGMFVFKVEILLSQNFKITFNKTRK